MSSDISGAITGDPTQAGWNGQRKPAPPTRTRVTVDTVRGVIPLLKAQWRVLVALMIRDLSSRFFGSKFGNLVTIAWILTHIFILVGIYSFTGRVAPFGDSAALWFAIGIVQFQSFSYMAHHISLGAFINKQLLMFPAVKFTDIVFSRALVEILNTGVVVIVTGTILTAARIDVAPANIVQASLALGSAMLLGLGSGVINGIIVGMVPMWLTGWALFRIVLWIASGVVFVPATFPDPVQYALSFNPITQSIEWMRMAYFEGYTSKYFDKSYVLWVGLSLFFGGLLVERLMRGKILQS